MSACSNVLITSIQCPQGSEGGFESPGTKDTGGCELPCGSWEPSVGPLPRASALAVLDLTL